MRIEHPEHRATGTTTPVRRTGRRASRPTGSWPGRALPSGPRERIPSAGPPAGRSGDGSLMAARGRPITASSAALVRLFTPGPGSVSLQGGALRLGSDGAIPVGALDAVELRRRWLWTRMTLRVAGGGARAIGGLGRGDAELLAAAIREEAARVAGRMAPRLAELDGRLARFHEANRWRRDSLSRGLQEEMAGALGLVRGALARSHLPPEAAEALSRIEPLASPGAFEAAREAANSRYVSAWAPAVTRSAAAVLSRRPTAEQAAAIATDEDVTLVLAGAGTGKTAVTTGKIAHLVRDRGVPPGEILVLAFNRKAADEIRERLPDDLDEVNVYTFHAFGRRVIADVGVAPTVSKLAEDEARFVEAVDRILHDLLADEEHSAAVSTFLARYQVAYRSQFDFETPGAYYDHVRAVELRTLTGEMVKSFEELTIANVLARGGVAFCYEEPYEVDTATSSHQQYRPDFYLPDHDIYIEHFALDREGRPPPGWRGYADGVRWKRGIHADHGTSLIETYSWQAREGVLESSLLAQLEEAGVTFTPVPLASLLDGLGRRQVSRLAQLVATFLNHAKTSGLLRAELRARVRESRDEAFLDLFEQVRARYEELLGDERDFHDLIGEAAAHIRAGRWTSPYRHVLVDEFQDVSSGRMALLEALTGPGVAHFLVGDDWQSIYRFAGSDVGLVRGCGPRLGRVRERTLEQSFRFAGGILEPSAAFVVRNPAQTQRALRPASGVPDGGVVVVAAEDDARGLERALADIERREGKDGAPLSVLVLGRYRDSRRAMASRRRGRLRLEFSTVHAAKGREADYAIVLDLRDARRGFPSQLEDDPLLDLVLPPQPGGRYAHDEERRLLYVAMTRARRGAYLVADALRPSTFVEELLRESPRLRRLGEFRSASAPECPRCRTGRLEEAGRGRVMGCRNFPFCRYRAPRCERCRRGFVVIAGARSRCTRDSCDASPPVCGSCGIGVMLRRRARRGWFLGCSEYASDQPCTHTRSLPDRGR